MLLLLAPSAVTAAETLRVVGSPLLARPIKAVMDRLVAASLIAPPEIELGLTPAAVATFCRSWDKDSPSVLALARRLRIPEADECALNGVSEIIEIQLGYQALVLVEARAGEDFPLRLQDLHAAVAKEVHDGTAFVANPNQRWRQLNEKLPNATIRVIVPRAGSDSRTFFDERFLEAACRRIPALRAIAAAAERVARCATLRDDGVVVEHASTDIEGLQDLLKDAAPGTIAVLAMVDAPALSELARMLPIDGVPPSPTTIAARTYPFMQPLFVYVKRLHVQDFLGRGAIAGLRELITEITREQTIGPDGYLVPEGLIPMTDERRAEVRDRALGLVTMER